MQYQLATLGLVSLLAPHVFAAPVPDVVYTTVWVSPTAAPAPPAPAVANNAIAAPAPPAPAVANNAQGAPSAGGGGPSIKKGLAFNAESASTSAATSFTKDQVSWGWNWGATDSANLASKGIEFVPTYKTPNSGGFNVPAGTKNVFGWNEADVSYSASDASLCSDYVNNYVKGANGAKIGSPSTTSTQDPNKGYNWLLNFQKSCPAAKWDFVTIHAYMLSGQEDFFYDYVKKVMAAFPGTPIVVSEFALVTSDYLTPISDAAEQQKFIDSASKWLDSQDQIKWYSPFMIKNAPGFISSGAGGYKVN